MEQNIVTSSSQPITDYEELTRRRRMLELDIARQEQRVAVVFNKIAMPQGLIKRLSNMVIGNFFRKPSIVNSLTNSWRWTKWIVSLLKRFL